ncbi:MAG: polysaccharide deacetylase family protein [Deltaproteobacteria bacterium]|nr:polysaccharide deacetylase family protein [Deltaproteobacteria bacterium]
MSGGGLTRLTLAAAERSGGFALARRLTARPARIVMYHHFSAAAPAPPGRTAAHTFRQQLRHLRRHFRPVRLIDLARRLAAGEAPEAGSVAITVDDGHANFLRVAEPILREFDVPATLFVLSQRSNSGEWLWVDKWEYLRQHADSGPRLTELRHMPPADRDHCLAAHARHLGVALPERPPPAYELVSWDELKRALHGGLVDVGSHTRTHRILADAGRDEAWREIDGSKRELEQRLGVEVATFCFPNGHPADYRAAQVEMAARAGYACAVAAHFGFVTERSNRFALPRMGRVFGDLSSFRRDLDGPEYLWRRLRGQPVW